MKYKWDRQFQFDRQFLLNKGTFGTRVTRKGETPKGTGRNSSNWERKADKGVDVMQNRKEQKAGDNKEEKNSWVPGKKNKTRRDLGDKEPRECNG